jgi:hypothetical protein
MGRVLTLLCAVVVAAPALAGPYSRRVPGITPAVSGAARKGGGSTCAERLANKVYRCDVAVEGGSTFTDCLRFTSPGAVSDNFDLTTDQLGATLGCTCQAKGKPSKPKFDASSAFTCTGDEDVSFEGTVARSGKKIGKGFAANAAGTGFLFTCKQDDACTP